jgi:photosystem I subunit 3
MAGATAVGTGNLPVTRVAGKTGGVSAPSSKDFEDGLMSVLRMSTAQDIAEYRTAEMLHASNVASGKPSVTALLERLEESKPPPAPFDIKPMAGKWTLEFTNEIPLSVRQAGDQRHPLLDVAVILSISEDGSIETTGLLTYEGGGTRIVSHAGKLVQRDSSAQFSVKGEMEEEKVLEVSYLSDDVLIMRQFPDAAGTLSQLLQESGVADLSVPKALVWRKFDSSSMTVPALGRASLWRFGLNDVTPVEALAESVGHSSRTLFTFDFQTVFGALVLVANAMAMARARWWRSAKDSVVSNFEMKAAPARLATAAFVGEALEESANSSAQREGNKTPSAANTPSVADESAPAQMATVAVSRARKATRWIACGLAAGLLAVTLTAPVEARQGWLNGDYLEPGRSNPIASGILEQCKDNKKYKKNLKNELYKFDQSKKKYPAGSVVWNRIEASKKLAERRAEAYGTRWCGKKDGRPRVLTTFESFRGGVLVPAIMFLYIAGQIGWAGRSYLLRTQDAQKEINIDVPLALNCMVSAFAFPVLAWQEIVNGEMVVSDRDIYKGLF